MSNFIVHTNFGSDTFRVKPTFGIQGTMSAIVAKYDKETGNLKIENVNITME